MSTAGKIGLIAGGGDLPLQVVSGAQQQGYEVFTAALEGFANPADFTGDVKSFGIGEIGRLIKTFRSKNCTYVTMAGNISRPDFKTVKPDFKGLKLLPKVIKAAAKGDDALLKFLVSVFEKENFEILAPQDLCVGALMGAGLLGSVGPSDDDHKDIKKAMRIAREIGAHDIGQGAVVCRGLVLAVEAQEGTDKMLERVAGLDPNLLGGAEARAGVLAKCLKPGQEERVDLPTIGVATIERAAKAGLAGIALEAGKAFVLDKAPVQARADELGVFILGLENGES